MLARRALSADQAPAAEDWRSFLDTVSKVFETHDRDRSLIERSLTISSAEMADLYEELRRSSESELARERDKLLESERRLAEAQELARLGSWDWDVPSNALDWSSGLKLIYGVGPDEPVAGDESFLERVHPDDRAFVSGRIADALTTHEPFTFDHRIIRPDGALRIVQVRGKVVVDGDGVVVRMFGTGQDVTEARRLEDELRRSGERIVSEAAAMVGALDVPTTLQAIADAIRRALGADRATCYVHAGDTINAVYTTETDPERRAFLEGSVATERRRMPIWDYLLSQPEPLLAVEDVRADPRISSRLADALGAGAFVGIRLEHASVEAVGEPVKLGTIFCSWREPRVLTAANRSDARGLANLAAMALANARLHAETMASLTENRAMAGEQAALRRVATAVAREATPEAVFALVAEEVARLLDVECGLVARFEAAEAVPVGWWGTQGTTVGLAFSLEGGGSLAQVARSGRAARVDDDGLLAGDAVPRLAGAGSYRGAVAAPVRVAGRIWGAVLAATTRSQPIAPGAEERLSGFAELLGLAIANALASQQAERQASIHRAVLETAHDAFVAIDAGGTIRDWNPQAEAVFGWTRAEALGRSLADLVIPPAARAAHRHGLARFLATGQSRALNRRLEMTALHRDGRELPVEMTISALELEDGYRFSAFLRDIGDRKRAERYVGAQHAVTRVLAESASLEEAGARVLQALGGSMGWDLGALWSVDAKARVLRCDELWQAPGLAARDFAALSRETALPQGAGLPGRVWASGEAAWIEDLASDDNFPRRDAAGAAGLRSAFALPIRGQGEVLAVMEFFRREAWRPDADITPMMATIGSQLGQFFERKRAERDADRLKDEFFALVSHELRTPLTSISGYLEILLEEDDEPLSDGQRRRFLGVIDRNARRLERLVGDLLFVARLEEGRLRLEPAAVDLGRLADEALEVAAPMAEHRGIRLRLAAEPIPIFLADPGRLGQSLDNLLSNALKFTPDGGRVDVTLSRRGERAIIEIRDTGVGIPRAEQERLFERFFRASTATDRAIPGVGLGLTIVRAIVEGHGGAITVESEEGRGATFRLELPLVPPPSAVADPIAHRAAPAQRQPAEPASVKLEPAIGTKRQS
ncbi:MAG: hypothetical protein QOK40_784 [Miltoncostaeaceae bacterium]|nr:hypothetical protein [Miltoncostaeaceae bacterium]